MITNTHAVVREAAVINMLDVTSDPDELDRIKAELWCIREGINTMEHPELWDLTLGIMTTTSIIDYVLNSGHRDRHESAAFLLCTIRELS